MDTKVTESLIDDDLHLLIKACAGKEFRDRRDEAIIRLMAETGMRAGEVCGLTVPDVDLVRGLVTVRRGKGGRGRVAPFAPQAGRAIDRYLRMRRSHLLADTPALWLGDRGKSLEYYGLHKALKYRAELAGLRAGRHRPLADTRSADRLWQRGQPARVGAAGGSEARRRGRSRGRDDVSAEALPGHA